MTGIQWTDETLHMTIRGTDYSDTAAKDLIWVRGQTAPASSWWATADRVGFTARARKECDRKETTSHGRKRGPDYHLEMDRPVGE